MRFLAGGERLLTASADGTARIWSAATGALLTVLRHRGPVTAAAPGSGLVATASADGTARIWSLDVARLTALACRIASRNLTQAEWRQYVGADPYFAACDGRPIPAKIRPRSARG